MMCSTVSNTSHINFLIALKQLRGLVEEKDPEKIPEEFWKESAEKVEKEIK